MMFLVTCEHRLEMRQGAAAQCRQIAVDNDKGDEKEKENYMNGVDDLYSTKKVDVLLISFDFPEKQAGDYLCRDEKDHYGQICLLL